MYINSKCCLAENHITNFVGKAYAKGMGKQLADIHGWLDDLAHGMRGSKTMTLFASAPSSASRTTLASRISVSVRSSQIDGEPTPSIGLRPGTLQCLH